MRTPAAAAVNVVMKENVAKSFGSAKYKGMQDLCSRVHCILTTLRDVEHRLQAQIRSLTNEFEEGFATG